MCNRTPGILSNSRLSIDNATSTPPNRSVSRGYCPRWRSSSRPALRFFASQTMMLVIIRALSATDHLCTHNARKKTTRRPNRAGNPNRRSSTSGRCDAAGVAPTNAAPGTFYTSNRTARASIDVQMKPRRDAPTPQPRGIIEQISAPGAKRRYTSRKWACISLSEMCSTRILAHDVIE